MLKAVENATFGNFSGQWFALCVFSGQETEAAQRLSRYGVATYWPKGRRWRRAGHGRHLRTVVRPIMPGYLFAALCPRQWPALHLVPMVYGVVGMDGRPVPVPVAELIRIRVAEAEGQYDEPEPGEARRRTILQVGAHVSVVGTVLDGWVGVVAAAANGRGVAVDVGGKLVTVPVDSLRAVA
jgi:transcription antitermination factor NusG